MDDHDIGHTHDDHMHNHGPVHHIQPEARVYGQKQSTWICAGLTLFFVGIFGECFDDIDKNSYVWRTGTNMRPEDHLNRTRHTAWMCTGLTLFVLGIFGGLFISIYFLVFLIACLPCLAISGNLDLLYYLCSTDDLSI